MDHNEHCRERRHGAAYWLVVCGFLAAAAFYLWTEHRAHLLGALPYLILLACPLMHVFMHHGHGGHAHGDEAGSARAGDPRAEDSRKASRP